MPYFVLFKLVREWLWYFLKGFSFKDKIRLIKINNSLCYYIATPTFFFRLLFVRNTRHNFGYYFVALYI